MAEKQLLFKLTRKDFVIEEKRGHGKGGQHKNVTNSAIRITHPPSGAVAQSQEERSKHQNEMTAFRRLIETPKFKTWHKMEVARKLGHLKEVEQAVDKAMEEKNIKVEVKDSDGKWVVDTKTDLE